MLASVGWYGFYTQYYYSGDSSFVAPVYDRLHRYLHDVWKLDADGLVITRGSDWNWADWGPNQDFGVLTNCWYYLALKAEKEFALMLGKTDDAAQITAIMQDIEQNFDKRFWTGTAYRRSGLHQTDGQPRPSHGRTRRPRFAGQISRTDCDFTERDVRRTLHGKICTRSPV